MEYLEGDEPQDILETLMDRGKDNTTDEMSLLVRYQEGCPDLFAAANITTPTER